MGKLYRQILKGMIISQGWFFSDFHECAMYCGIAWRQTFQECFESSSKNDVEYSETEWNHRWLSLVTENLSKNPVNFSSTHVRICVKDATPLPDLPWSISITYFLYGVCITFIAFARLCQILAYPLSKTTQKWMKTAKTFAENNRIS